jgi:hypothetical protein
MVDGYDSDVYWAASNDNKVYHGVDAQTCTETPPCTFEED